MKRHNIISFLAGVLSAVLLCTVVVPVLAAYTKTIEVYPNSIKLFVDDVMLEPKDVNGNPVDIFVYNGTTYVPIRAVSNALGKPVQYDGSVGEAYIGKHTGDKPAVWLSDLDYFDKSGNWYTYDSRKDNLGIDHRHNLETTERTNYITYVLNGQYSQLTGTLFQIYGNRDDHAETIFEVYGDDELLWSGNMRGGVEPMNFKINITGVLKLRIKVSGMSDAGAAYNACLGDLGLWT